MSPQAKAKPAPSGSAPSQTRESKADRFKRVASKRTNDVLRSLDALAKTANKASYEYTDEEVTAIVQAITDKVTALQTAYQHGGVAAPTFSLNGGNPAPDADGADTDDSDDDDE